LRFFGFASGFQSVTIKHFDLGVAMKKPKVLSENHKWLLPIAILILINLIIGFVTFQNYGESIDEARLSGYADQSLSAYKSWLQPSYQPDFGGDDLRYYGPAYVMGITLVIRLLGMPNSGILTGDIWHLAGFITFQGAVLCIYLLGRRWVGNWAAFGITLLFSTQPLLWGHAFINPKDSPFLAFFLASIVSGLWMCDQAIASSDKDIIRRISVKPLLTRIMQAWQNMSQCSKNNALIISAVWLSSIIALVIGAGVLNGWIAIIVQKGYFADPLSLAGRLFERLAHHANYIPVENYIHKAQTLFRYLRNTYFVLGAILIIWLYRSALPWSIRLPSKREVLTFTQQFGLSFIKHPVIIAGIILGLTTSIRVLGPLAGLIVGLYALWRKGKRAQAPLLAYAVITLIVMYLTWPYLWSDPFNHIIESINTMSTFPWLGTVLYNGVYYQPDKLPWSYLPVLLSIQFTEPVVALSGVGLVISVYNFIRRKNVDLLGFISVWFLIPVFLIVITYRPLYDNFRQLLFLTPPIFILCGVGIDALFRVIKKWKRFCQVALIFIIILPGVYNGLKLHPYEYIYYNSLVGGTGGAFRRFETDYWMTSSREVAKFLSRTAQPFSKIVVDGPSNLVSKYTRQDLIIEPKQGGTYGSYDYVVLFSRYDRDQVEFTNNKPAFIVQRDGAVLAVVKYFSNSPSP
jgi:hypothetical protein